MTRQVNDFVVHKNKNQFSGESTIQKQAGYCATDDHNEHKDEDNGV